MNSTDPLSKEDEMTAEITIRTDADSRYPTPAESEQGARERGWVPAYSVRGERDRPDTPENAVYFKLAEGTGRAPIEWNAVWDIEDLDEAIALAERWAHEYERVEIAEISAYDRESSAAERAYEAQYG